MRRGFAVRVVLTATAALAAFSAAATVRAQPPAAPSPPPQGNRWFANAENVRRVTPGEKYVAFATSGGVRVWDRASDTWRLLTMNDGLPTNNVFDVTFAPDDPGTLWTLCGDWVQLDTDPMPRLHLATIRLSDGVVTRQGAPSGIAPKTARSYKFFLDYRLAVGKTVAAVAAANRVVLAFDRTAGQWADSPVADAPLARASHLPGMRAIVSDVITSPNHAAVLTPTGVYLYDRQTNQWSPRPFPMKEQKYSVLPGTLRFVGDSGSVTFQGFRMPLPTPDSQGRTLISRVVRGRFRVNPVTTGITLEEENPRPPAPGPPRPTPPLRPNLTFCTDLVGDGKYLWFAGYNQPFRPRNGGLARLDMTTGQWHYPATPPGGLGANVGSLTRLKSGKVTHRSSTVSLYDPTKQAFADVTDFRSFGNELWADQPWATRRSIPDPRVGPEERTLPVSLIATVDEHTSLAYATEKPFLFVVNGQPNREGMSPFATFLYDHRTKELTLLSGRVPDMKDFNPSVVRKFGDSLFLFGETRRPVLPNPRGRNAPPTPAPPPLLTVWRWNPKTGDAHAFDRVTWTEAQRERDNRAQRWAEQLERRRRGSREPLVFEPAPETNITEAAGRLWYMVERRLFSYDGQTDAWREHGGADSLHAEAPSALWVLTHAKGGVPGTVRRWDAATGWQRILVDDVTASMLAAFAPDVDKVWLGGVGVVSVPRRDLKFAPLETAP